MSYASIADLVVYGLPSTALGSLTTDQKQAALDTASGEIDSYLRGRYGLPLATWGVEITKACAVIAAYELMNVRGFNPAAGADSNLELRHQKTLAWLSDVQHQAAHPNVQSAVVPELPPATQAARPLLISSSTAAVGSGQTAANRGW